MEWGQKAYELLGGLKNLFAPTLLLHPGFFLNKVGPPPPPLFPLLLC